MIVGFTSYINAYPFHWAFRNGLCESSAQLQFAPPAILNQNLREGKLDAALISSWEYLQGGYHFLTPFGIGAKDAIYSVNFYVRKWASVMTCQVTKESATSVALLKVLAAHFWNIKLILKPFDFTEDALTEDSFLLIGNQALENQNFNGFEKIDLAKEWVKYTGKEFVFALLATRNIDAVKLQFCQKLDSSLDLAFMHFDQILQEAKLSSQHSYSFLQAYYQAHTYRLSESAFEGLTLFGKLLNNV